jgi:hypothetical protein
VTAYRSIKQEPFAFYGSIIPDEQASWWGRQGATALVQSLHMAAADALAIGLHEPKKTAPRQSV